MAFLAAMAGAMLAAGVGTLTVSAPPPPRQAAAPPPAAAAAPAPAPGAAAPAATPQAEARPPYAAARLDLPPPAETPPPAVAQRWLTFGASGLMLLAGALVGVGLAARRRDPVVQDSPAFRRALEAVQPLLAHAARTPRLVKRFQNRMRYDAERLRPQPPQTDWVDGLLHAIGRRTGHAIVPRSWFAPDATLPMPEQLLILHGAIAEAAPWAIGAAEGPVAAMDRYAAANDDLLAQAWARTYQAYAAAFPAAAPATPAPVPAPQPVSAR
jgi:hypothetical protein